MREANGEAEDANAEKLAWGFLGGCAGCTGSSPVGCETVGEFETTTKEMTFMTHRRCIFLSLGSDILLYSVERCIIPVQRFSLQPIALDTLSFLLFNLFPTLVPLVTVVVVVVVVIDVAFRL